MPLHRPVQAGPLTGQALVPLTQEALLCPLLPSSLLSQDTRPLPS